MLAASVCAQNLDLMKGTGNIQRTSEGGTNFTFVVPVHAYDGIIDDKEKLKEQHDFLIGSYLGQSNACAKGYKITDQQIVDKFYIYTGNCK